MWKRRRWRGGPEDSSGWKSRRGAHLVQENDRRDVTSTAEETRGRICGGRGGGGAWGGDVEEADGGGGGAGGHRCLSSIQFPEVAERG